MSRLFLALGSGSALLAVILGAFGAHGLRERISPAMLAVWHTANQYHFYHALGLLAVGLLAQHLPHSACLRWAGWLLCAGLVLFSGSLYVLSISGLRWLGVVTPFGGIAFIVAWALVLLAVLRL